MTPLSQRILVAVAITFVATSLLWVGVIVGLYWHFYGSEPPFRVAINHPAEVSLGSEVVVTLAVENSSDEPVTLGSVDIYDSFLDGFEFVGSNPDFTSSDDLMNFKTLWFDTELHPAQPAEITLTIRATKSGRHGGQLDICTPSEICTTVYATIAVTEAS